MRIVRVIFGLLFLVPASAFLLQDKEENEGYTVFSDKWEHPVIIEVAGEKKGKSLLIDDSYGGNPFEGNRCIRISADKSEMWREVYFSCGDSAHLSAEGKPVVDLSEFEMLEFAARSETKEYAPYIITEIGVGEENKNGGKRSESYLLIDQMWQRYTIPLKGLNLHSLNTLLFLKLNDGTLYLDEVRFIKRKKKK